MFILQLNMMRNRMESLDAIAYADTEQELHDLLARERVESYTEQGPGGFGSEQTFRKNFRKGGPLEWYNPPYDYGNGQLVVGDGASAIVKIGTRLEYMECAAEEWDRLRSRFPNASTL